MSVEILSKQFLSWHNIFLRSSLLQGRQLPFCQREVPLINAVPIVRMHLMDLLLGIYLGSNFNNRKQMTNNLFRMRTKYLHHRDRLGETSRTIFGMLVIFELLLPRRFAGFASICMPLRLFFPRPSTKLTCYRPFYGLGMNSPKIISVIWYGSKPQPADLYELLVSDIWQSLVVVSVGAIVGCLITLVAIDMLGRKVIQLIGFFFLFILFIVIGASFNHLYDIGGTSATIVLYILCQIFFNFGPNTTTYIVSSSHSSVSSVIGSPFTVASRAFSNSLSWSMPRNLSSFRKAWLRCCTIVSRLYQLRLETRLGSDLQSSCPGMAPQLSLNVLSQFIST